MAQCLFTLFESIKDKAKRRQGVMLLSFCKKSCIPTMKLLENTLYKGKLPDVWRKLCLNFLKVFQDSKLHHSNMLTSVYKAYLL